MSSKEKDRYDIRGILLNHMGEIAAQLEKGLGFIENIKTMLIPILNKYLGAEDLEVALLPHRLRKRQGRNWQHWL